MKKLLSFILIAAMAISVSEAIEDMNANVNWEDIRAQYADIANDLGVTNEQPVKTGRAEI